MSTDSITGTVVAGGAEIPALGLGTARMSGDECRRAVEAAIAAGYRHVDTAQMYENEAAVGDALENATTLEAKRSGRAGERGPGGDRNLPRDAVSRDEVTVVTKVHRRNLAYDDVVESTLASRDRLGLDRIDLLLIHAPSGDVPIAETIGAMNELQDDDVVEHIGVSNFSVEQLEAAIDASETPIVTNQVKYHPYHGQDELLEYCIDEEIVLTAYSPLAKGDVVGDDRLEAIGERYGKSAPQVAIRWLLQQPYVAAIPKASSREHIEANADVFDFELTDDEMREVFEIDGGLRRSIKTWLGL